MHKRIIGIFVALTIYAIPLAIGSQDPSFSSTTVITFGHSGGRLGDNLIAYLHAKWISYQTGYPLLCNVHGFHHAEHFVLYDKERNLHNTPHPPLQVNVSKITSIQSDTPATFIIPYFPESSWEWKENGGNWDRLFAVDWKNPKFRQMCLEMIAPKNAITLALPPSGVISIAIHARQGGNFEAPSPQVDAPLKRPPMTYYRDALHKIIQLFPGQALYCRIFTDAVHPESIVETIKEGLSSDLPIELSWRTEANHDAINVIEDFFSLFHYDILIRPESNFSMVPSLLHEYDVLVTPKHACYSPEIYIDDIEIQVNSTPKSQNCKTTTTQLSS